MGCASEQVVFTGSQVCMAAIRFSIVPTPVVWCRHASAFRRKPDFLMPQPLTTIAVVIAVAAVVLLVAIASAAACCLLLMVASMMS